MAKNDKQDLKYKIRRGAGYVAGAAAGAASAYAAAKGAGFPTNPDLSQFGVNDAILPGAGAGIGVVRYGYNKLRSYTPGHRALRKEQFNK